MSDKDLMTEALFAGGARRKLRETVNKIGPDLARGATDQADESFRRAAKLSGQLLKGELYEPSEKLTEGENKRYKQLLQQRYYMDEGTLQIEENKMELPDLVEMEKLESKYEDREFHPINPDNPQPGYNPFKVRKASKSV